MADKNAETNGAVPIEERIVLSAEQADVFRQLFAMSQQINEKLQIALAGAGIVGDIVGGDLTDNPHLVISKPDPGQMD